MIWLIIYVLGANITFGISYGAIFAFLQGRRTKDQLRWEESDSDLAMECSWYPAMVWPLGVFLLCYTLEWFKYGFRWKSTKQK